MSIFIFLGRAHIIRFSMPTSTSPRLMLMSDHSFYPAILGRACHTMFPMPNLQRIT